MQSKKDLYQIGEVARLFHLSISLLRHYDKTGLVTPEYTDPDTGYRYYSIRQFECLNTIRYLRALDMPLEEIGDFLHNRDTGRIQELLSKQLVQVHKKQQELTVIEHQIKNRLNQIQGALSAHPGEIFLEKKSPLQLACMKKQLNPENYLDLEYSIREMEQGNSPASIFLGKVGVGLFYDSLKAHRFKPYKFFHTHTGCRSYRYHFELVIFQRTNDRTSMENSCISYIYRKFAAFFNKTSVCNVTTGCHASI